MVRLKFYLWIINHCKLYFFFFSPPNNVQSLRKVNGFGGKRKFAPPVRAKCANSRDTNFSEWRKRISNNEWCAWVLNSESIWMDLKRKRKAFTGKNILWPFSWILSESITLILKYPNPYAFETSKSSIRKRTTVQIQFAIK